MTNTTRITKKSLQEQETKEAKKELKRLIGTSTDIYCTLNHVSQSGMLRIIDFHLIKKNKPVWITPLMEKALGFDYKRDTRRYGLRVQGCGMDMGFSVVYNLSVALYCYRYGKFKYDHDGAYRLNTRWLN